MLLANLPRDIVLHVLARFVPVAVMRLVSASRALYASYAGDASTWLRCIDEAQRTEAGRVALMHAAPALLTRCPALARTLPLPIIPSFVLCMATSHNGALVACFHEKRVVVLDTARYREVARVLVGRLCVRGIAFSRDDTLLALATSTSVCVCECAPNAKQWKILRKLCPASWESVVFGAHDQLLAQRSNGLALLEARGADAPLAQVQQNRWAACIAASASLFAWSSTQGVISLSLPGSLQAARQLGFDEQRQVQAMVFSRDGTTLASLAVKDPNDYTTSFVAVWAVADGACVKIIPVGVHVGGIALSSSGLLVVPQIFDHALLSCRLGDGDAFAEMAVVQQPMHLAFVGATDKLLVLGHVAKALGSGWNTLWEMKVG